MSTPSPRIDILDWDDWNLEHIRKHDVTQAEVEEVIAGDAIYHGSYKHRLAATGPTVAGRILTVIIGEAPHRPHQYYVFSARPASRSERREFSATRKGGPS